MSPSAVVGRVLGAAIDVAARVRPAPKVMHPRGQVHAAMLSRHGSADPAHRSGAAWLDDAGRDDVLVRFSRSAGLPVPLPDVGGLAIRVPDGAGGSADLLLSGTGRGRLGRFVLAPTLGMRARFLSTLLPHRSPTGPVLVAARAASERTWHLLWARPRGPWTTFGALEVADEPGRDLDLSFDPVGTAPQGLEVYGWHRRLRAPSYAAARSVRSARRRR